MSGTPERAHARTPAAPDAPPAVYCVTVTGAASTTIQWTVEIRATETIR